MGKRIRLCAAFGLMVLVAAGCSTVGESLGFTPPANPLTKSLFGTSCATLAPVAHLR